MAYFDPWKLLELKDGWGGIHTVSIDEETLRFAMNLSGEIAGEFSRDPQYVPCGGGEVQVEWHCDGWDVELYVCKAD